MASGKSHSQHAFPLLFVFLFLMHNVQVHPRTIWYNCSKANSCQTYVIYRTAAPNFVDLAAIGDLFGVSRLAIAKTSNLSLLNSTLLPHQPLLVPIKCSVNTISYATVNYTMREGDTLFVVSSQNFQNLVTYESVLDVNPTIYDVRNISAGKNVVFPIFCKCATPSQLVKYLITKGGSTLGLGWASVSITNTAPPKILPLLITYVFQPNDTLRAVALRFGTTEKLILEINGDDILPRDAIFIPVSRLPNLTLITAPPPPPPPPPHHHVVVSERKGFVLWLGVGLGICGLLLALTCGVLCSGKGQFKRILEGIRNEEVNHHHQMIKLKADVAGCLGKYRVFKIEELRKATNGFDDGFIIKGLVYRGSIDNEIYAIKKIKWDAHEELNILQKVNHGNLVRLEGFCIDPKDSSCYLVYEYLENGSLYSWLHVEKNKRLSWNTRLRIAIDVANGLQYIHEHNRPKVVHKDIKSSNILLDSNMRAKIASFGLAKSGQNAVTMHIKGTRGYT
ncbi:hypothetical protein ACS0TY_022811 [Phlomoides rotata]